MQLLNNKTVASGIRAGAKRPARVSAVVCRASSETVDRRSIIGTLAGGVALLGAAPAFAEYGDGANIFGKTTNKSGFVPYSGDNFSVLLPSKWNPSKEREFPDIVLRYEDNFDAVNNFLVISKPSDKTSIEGYGSPEQFLEQVSFLLGRQAYSGETVSEGGFAPNRVSAASLLDVTTSKDKKGRSAYLFNILTRTADGDEGGRHQLIKATVANGKLWIVKTQAGDKRWFKGTKKECVGIIDSFTVA